MCQIVQNNYSELTLYVQIVVGALTLVLVAVFVFTSGGGDVGPAPQPSAAQARLLARNYIYCIRV